MHRVQSLSVFSYGTRDLIPVRNQSSVVCSTPRTCNLIATFRVQQRMSISQARYLIDWIQLLAPKHLGFFRDLSLLALTISPSVSQ